MRRATAIISGGNQSQIVNQSGLILDIESRKATSYPGAGTNWYDLSPIGNDCTLLNGIGYNGIDKKIILDGIDDVVQTPINFPLTATTDYTISVYFKPSSFTTQAASNRTLISNYDAGKTPFNLRMNPDGRVFLQAVGDNGSIGNLFSTTYLNTSFIYEVACSKLGNVFSIFVNGNLENSITANIGVSNVSNNIQIGKFNTFNTGHYSGDLYNIKLYNECKTPSEILSNYNIIKH